MRIRIRCYGVIPFCLVPFCPIKLTRPISSNILKMIFRIVTEIVGPSTAPVSTFDLKNLYHVHKNPYEGDA